MSIKSFAARIFARRIARKTAKWVHRPIETQDNVFTELIKTASKTLFGKNHYFAEIETHADFVKNVPIRDYEELKDYVEKVVSGDLIFFGPENLFILRKLQVQLLAQNIFRLQKCL